MEGERMTEIKFRAWDKKRKRMFAVTTLNASGAVSVFIDDDGLYLLPAEQVELMQYTGIKDKNGKEIYEGDIVRYGNDNAAIIWREKNAEFGVKWLDCGVEDSISWQIGIEKTPSEVIGNIHENAELLG